MRSYARHFRCGAPHAPISFRAPLVFLTLALTLAGCGRGSDSSSRSADPDKLPEVGKLEHFTGSAKDRKSARSAAGEAILPGATTRPGTEAMYRWHRQLYLGAYDKSDSRSPKWDAQVQEALDLFAHLRSDWSADASGAAGIEPRVIELLKQSISTGCRDPLAGYVLARLQWFASGQLTQEIADQLKDAAEDMEQLEYSPILKAYSYFRAFDAGRTLAGESKDNLGKRTGVRLQAKAYEYLDAALHTPDLPGAEAADMYESMFEHQLHPTFLAEFDRLLNGRWPTDPRIQALRGRLFLQSAWFQRGNGFAGTVTEDQWKGFAAALNVAEKALEFAWKGNPEDSSIPVSVLELEVAEGKGRDRLELWFQRAMKLDTNSWQACWWKLEYLEPKWHGSVGEAVAFGRECLTNTAWHPRLGDDPGGCPSHGCGPGERTGRGSGILDASRRLGGRESRSREIFLLEPRG